MNEFFTIPGHEDYEISINGEIRKKSVMRFSKRAGQVDTGEPGRTLRYAYKKNMSYPYINTSKSEGVSSRKIYIHIAMARTFIPNPDNHSVVMHLDDNPSNFAISNLKWGTQKDNMKQSSDIGHYSTVKQSVWLISPEGILTHAIGLRAFCAEHGLDWGNFQKVIKRKPSNNSIKGWRLAPDSLNK